MLCEYVSETSKFYQTLVENSIFNTFTVNLYQIINDSQKLADHQ